MEPSTLAQQADAGGMHTPPVLGQVEAVRTRYQLEMLDSFRSTADLYLRAAVCLIFAVLALSLMRLSRSELNRTDPVWAWLAALFLLYFLYLGVLNGIKVYTQLLSAAVTDFLLYGVSVPLVRGLWVMAWRAWFHLGDTQDHKPTRQSSLESRLSRAIPWLTALTTLVYGFADSAANNVFYPWLSVTTAGNFVLPSIVARVVLFGLLLLVVVLGIRRQGAEGWVVVPAVLLYGVAEFGFELTHLHIPAHFRLFGFLVAFHTIVHMLMLAALLVLMLRRLGQSLRRQREMAADLRQAQGVQQVILPEAVTRCASLVVESEYRPAREVGGDFYQVIPDEKDSSLLIVAGDVAGKGLQAGMLVGAARSIAELNSDPLFVLQALNRRLLGCGGAHATRLALRIEADGAATLANAGHLPPYLNGKPVQVKGSMPLGFFEGAEFSVLHFNLDPDDRLVLTSDGLAEAADAGGNLFGFEAVEKLAENRASAAELASVAQEFGQQDDISVIAVTRLASPVPA